MRSTLLRAAPSLVCALMHVPRPRTLGLCRERMPGLGVAIGNSLLQHLPWKPCRDKIFYRDRNGPALGKLCRDTRGPLSRPKHPVPAPNPITTLNFCRDTGTKNLCCDREGLCRDPNHPVSLGTMLQHGDPCRDIELESSVERVSQPRAQAGSCAWPENHVVK